jgi:hypothetical protein
MARSFHADMKYRNNEPVISSTILKGLRYELSYVRIFRCLFTKS